MTNALQESWVKEDSNRDTYADFYEMNSIDMHYTDRRLLSEREDGSFGRNAKNMFNLFILHDPLINKIILKMQENIIRDTNPDENKFGNLASWYDYGDLLQETMTENGSISTQTNLPSKPMHA